MTCEGGGGSLDRLQGTNLGAVVAVGQPAFAVVLVASIVV